MKPGNDYNEKCWSWTYAGSLGEMWILPNDNIKTFDKAIKDYFKYKNEGQLYPQHSRADISIIKIDAWGAVIKSIPLNEALRIQKLKRL
jgi:hypothetical protein